jgi:hypothetical protein
MKINDKILSIPPYISTTWNYIKSLQVKGPFLVITLLGGESINIPNLKNEVIELIFETHANHIENNKDSVAQSGSIVHSESMEMPFRMGFSSVEGMGNPLTHNPAQKDALDIPPQVLQKIAAIAKIISPEDIMAMPKAEPHCNCLHCQIVRAINASVDHEKMPKDTILEVKEEDVKDEDLGFQQWDVIQTGDNLFNVINRLDEQEKYSVFLGNPVGCTCGKSNCEHIIAVLKS